MDTVQTPATPHPIYAFVTNNMQAFSLGSPSFDATVIAARIAVPSGPLLGLPRTILTSSSDRRVAGAALAGAKLKGNGSGPDQAVQQAHLKALEFTPSMAQFTVAHELAHIKQVPSLLF